MKHQTGPGAATSPPAAHDVPRAPARTGGTAAALVRGAAVPLGACFVALLGLTAYTATGAAGAPPAEISVTRARVFLPTNPDATAAFFVITNTGKSPDTLESVTSPQLGTGQLARTVVEDGAGVMELLAGVEVPPGRTVTLTPGGVDVMITIPPALKLGQKITLDLGFVASGTVRVQAVVVRPGA